MDAKGQASYEEIPSPERKILKVSWLTNDYVYHHTCTNLPQIPPKLGEIAHRAQAKNGLAREIRKTIQRVPPYVFALARVPEGNFVQHF